MNQLIATHLFAHPSKLAVNSFIRAAAVVLILAGLLFLPYRSTLKYPSVFDDGHNIVNNPQIRMDEISLENLINAGIKSPCLNLLLANISFALNY